MEQWKALWRIFNPTIVQYKVATGRPYGHKVQKCSLHDTKSDHKEGLSGTKPTQRSMGQGDVRSWQGWCNASGQDGALMCSRVRRDEVGLDKGGAMRVVKMVICGLGRCGVLMRVAWWMWQGWGSDVQQGEGDNILTRAAWWVWVGEAELSLWLLRKRSLTAWSV